MAKHCIFVISSRLVDQRQAAWAKHLLSSVDANIMGVLLNKSQTGRGSEYYYYYYDKVRERV